MSHLDQEKCELCELMWIDPTYSQEEGLAEINSIKETGRCLGCIEEYGEDGYPDR